MDLLEGYQKWDRQTAPKTSEPLVTVQKGGLFSLNKAAHEAMGSPERVDLFYNPGKKSIAFVPADERSATAYPARQQGRQSNYYVAGQKFTKHHGIDTSVARRYPVKVHNQMLFVDLTGPSTIATGVRARERQS